MNFVIPHIHGGPLDLSRHRSIMHGAPSEEYMHKVRPEAIVAEILAPSGISYLEDLVNGGELKFITHPIETTTCEEKTELTSATPVKTLYFQHKDTREIYMFVLRGDRNINFNKAKELLGVDSSLRKQLEFAKELPQHMEPGTCGPFPHEKYVNEIKYLVVDSGIGKLNRVDISFGLNYPGVSAKQISMQISGQTMLEKIRGLYGTKVYAGDISVPKHSPEVA